jgi:hypothetical protein
MTTESSDTSKQPAKPLLGIRLRLMLLALLAVVPLTLDRVRVLEAGRSERIDRCRRDDGAGAARRRTAERDGGHGAGADSSGRAPM